ncbi:hypothetical protein BGZ76_011004 [Entomortierella beljakovae]|nr:hypothetical protein BGZ76_011004 [Entomortierella beljakovae]
MSDSTIYSTLSRKASIHNAPRPRSSYTALEIDIQYISSGNIGTSTPQNNNDQVPPNINNLHLNSVVEETEEEEGEGSVGVGVSVGAGVGGSGLPRPAPPVPRRPPQGTQLQLHPRTSRPMSDLYPQSPSQTPLPDDQFVCSYEPSVMNPQRVGSPFRIVAGPSASGSNIRHSTGGYDYKSTTSQHGYSPTNHTILDDIPGLSSSGSLSDDEDEIRSPIRSPIPQDHVSQDEINRERRETPEIETQETLKREKTRILERSIVNYRQIEYNDISNIQPLKKGGYGEIQTAEWSRLRVVLKRALSDTISVEQFEKELAILKRVHDYDHIVPFYGVTIDPVTNARCMVMKFCSNGNLCTFLEKNHEDLTWSERYRLSIEIAKGLEFLHKSGFHHHDLHSGNILLDDKRQAMICDFGLSKSSNRDHTNDLAAAIGVASFLAPERFPSTRPVYTAACDIYSLGVIFWHISSGRIPFQTRLKDPSLLDDLMRGLREDIQPNTPKQFRDLIEKCWDVKPAKRLKIDVVIAILENLTRKPSEPVHQSSTGFTVPAISAALPVPPDLDSQISNMHRASNTLNKIVFDITDPQMKEVVVYIENTRVYFRANGINQEPYSANNPPTTPIYLCPLVGDFAALKYYLMRGRLGYNPINESSEQTGDTALHLACLFLESPMNMIKILVELGADINLENVQGYTPAMILVSSNTEYCYEALKFFVMRGARIPSFIQKPITPLNNAQKYALHVLNESRWNNRENRSSYSSDGRPSYEVQDRRYSQQRISSSNQNVYQNRNGRKVERHRQGRPLIHVVAAMQEDYRILECLCDAGLDPSIDFSGETALVAAAAHLRIKNVEWLLNNDLEISNREDKITRAIKIVKLNYPESAIPLSGRMSTYALKETPVDEIQEIRELGMYSWAGVTNGDADRLSRDLAGPVIHLLEQWTGSNRYRNRKEVATKLKIMYGTDPATQYAGARNSTASFGSSNSDSSSGSASSQYRNQQRGLHARSQRKDQRSLIEQAMAEKAPIWNSFR